MSQLRLSAVLLLFVVGCEKPAAQVAPAPSRPTTPQATRPQATAAASSGTMSAAQPVSPNLRLSAFRKKYETSIIAPSDVDGEPAPEAPRELFDTIKYASPVGELKAYVTPDPKDGKKHPAIVWITGGDCNSIGDVWSPRPAKNDQSAKPYREAGIVMMFPSLRGGNGGPGVKESFYGEVDDVVAAAEHLAKLPYVDPERIYLGGHSTGGTLALLVAECSSRFRAVFSFGPVSDIAGYGVDELPFDRSRLLELELRMPGRWLHGIDRPTFVIEGTVESNIEELEKMRRDSRNPLIGLFAVEGANHFNVLDPTNRLITKKILADAGPKCTISFTQAELDEPFAR